MAIPVKNADLPYRWKVGICRWLVLRTRPVSKPPWDCHEYDVAISFAGEDREVANTLASGFSRMGMRVFYDDFERANLWGKNIYDHLSRVYKDEARFWVILVSKHYARRTMADARTPSSPS